MARPIVDLQNIVIKFRASDGMSGLPPGTRGALAAPTDLTEEEQ